MRFHKAVSLSLAVLFCAGLSGAARADESKTGPGSPAERYFTNAPLVDQNGTEHRFYADLLQGKIVIIQAMFTECAGVCPVMAGTLERVQEWAGDRLGKDVVILSFSVDPKDTPAKMKAFSERFHAKTGWYFLTGTKENWETALRKLGLYSENREAHSAVFTIGNDRTGLWKKALGVAKPKEIVEIVEGVAKDQG
ncbi:MAG: SCO family protein [Acidobacteriota bacterium]